MRHWRRVVLTGAAGYLASWFLPAYIAPGKSFGVEGYRAFLAAVLSAFFVNHESPRFAIMLFVSAATNTLFLALPLAMPGRAVTSRRFLAWLYGGAFLVNGCWLLWEPLVPLMGFSVWWLSFATVAIGLFLSESEGSISLKENGVAV